MTTKKFQKNLRSLLEILDNFDEIITFLVNKNAFTEQFIELVTESNLLTRYKGCKIDCKHDINQIIGQLEYELSLKNKKINVDITKNKIFSFYDSEEQLLHKMQVYIENEEFENATVLDKYLKLIDVKY
jgi:tRNA(Ser,Leu) C12 N-acetylase TAN1